MRVPLRAYFGVLVATLIILQIAGTSLSKQLTSWTQIWSDEFDGDSGSSVDANNWLIDTGHGYGCEGCPANWGTGEVESMPN